MPETIEAEIIEIDGAVPTHEAGSDPSGRPDYSKPKIRGAVLNLDRRWWPFWLIAAVLAVLLAATVGLFFGICYLAFSLIKFLARVLLGGLAGGHAGSAPLGRG